MPSTGTDKDTIVPTEDLQPAMSHSAEPPTVPASSQSDNSRYAFGYQEVGVYAQVMTLLRRFAGSQGLHLDIGCGYGAIAEQVRDLGLDYVGVDLAGQGLDSLEQRGFRTRRLDLQQPRADLVGSLRQIVGDAPLASISIIDTLEHVTNGPDVLAALAELCEGLTSALLVVAVPNVTHRDVGTKLLTGRWDYTSTGLLDDTHVIHHTGALLGSFTRAAGWCEVGAADYRVAKSDQHFPEHSVALSEHTSTGRYLQELADTCNPHSITNEFVRAYLRGAPAGTAYPSHHTQTRPFLSVIMRTQGRRRETLLDALTCLQGQESQDFEILVLPHKVPYERQLMVERLVDDLPDDLRHRTRIVLVDDGGRSRPLNAGIEAARGEYLAILDDDDLVLGNWVSTFKSMAQAAPGRVLRAVAVEQDIEEVTWEGGVTGVQTVSAARKRFTSQFDLFAHFIENHSPPVSLAFPTSVFHDLGLRFDETLNVLEDWDVLLRSALRVGVSDSPDVVGVYRRWAVGEASHTLHQRSEWLATEARILANIDRSPHVFPAGTIEAVRNRAGHAVGSEVSRHVPSGDTANLAYQLAQTQAYVEELKASHSWRLTKGVRAAGRLARTVRSLGRR